MTAPARNHPDGSNGLALRFPDADGAAMPPYNPDIERALLGMLMYDPERIDEVLLVLDGDDFFRESHRVVFGAIRARYDAGKPIDFRLVIEDLECAGELRGAGGDDAFGAMSAEGQITVNAVYYAQVVRQLSIARKLIEAGEETSRDGYSRKYTADELLGRAEERIFAIARSQSRDDTVGCDVVADEAWDLLMRRAGGEFEGIATGLAELDKIAYCLPNGGVTILAGRPGSGKAQPLDARVLTPSGFRSMGDLRVGDAVIGANGKICLVVGIYPQGELPVFRVTMSDGGSTECCEDHLWFTQMRNERRRGSSGSVKDLGEIMRTLRRAGGGSRNHAIPIVEPVEFSRDGAPLAIDPYAMGLLLGDGCFTANNVLFSNPEPDLQRRLADCLPASDALVVGDDRKDCRIRRSVRNNDVSSTKHAIAGYDLDGKDSYAKFIPDDYLFATIYDRIRLLTGLMDTDGYIDERGMAVEFTTSSPRLAEGVAFLTRSLGGIVSVRSRVPSYTYKGESRRGAESFRMCLYFPNGLVPVSSEKHLRKWRGGESRYHRSITEIEPIGYKQCQCIKVDAPDQLYVTDDFIVTHNTSLAMNICEHAAFGLGIAALFVSLEMRRQDLGTRLLASQARVSGKLIKRAYLLNRPEHRDDMDRLADARARIAASPLRINHAPGLTVSQIAAAARLEKARNGIGLLVIDYMSLINMQPTRGESRQEEVARTSVQVRNLARRLDIPVLLLCQLNRANENREDKRPRMSDLRESGQIEQDADMILLVHRPSYYDPSDRPGEADVLVAKNRCGETGRAKLAFLDELTRFENLAYPGQCNDDWPAEE